MKAWVKILSIGCFLSFFSVTAEGQDIDSTATAKIIKIEFEETQLDKAFQRFNGVHEYKNHDVLKFELKQAILKHGYAAYQWNSTLVGDSLVWYLRLGSRYVWHQIDLAEDTRLLLQKGKVNWKKIAKNQFDFFAFERAVDQALIEAENTGYPFAQIYLDSVSLINSGIEGVLKTDLGPLVKVDSVRIQGDLKIRSAYLQNYLGIREGALYSEKAIQRIPEKLESVRFLTSIKPPEVIFQDEITKINLFLNKKNASSFDGIIGFLPDNQTGELLVTGDVKLHLENTLKQGEIIDLNWRKLQTNTQELNVELVSPYILNSAVSIDANLKIYRRDTLFTDVFRQVGFRYVFGGDDYLRLFADRQTTSLISTSPYKFNVEPPPFLDRLVNSYGVGLLLTELDNRLNPAKGYELSTSLSAGNKTIIINDNLPEMIYDSLELTSLQLRGVLDASYYLSYIPKLVWHQRVIGAYLFNDQLFNNEAFRIGGLKNLRGVDEEAIFATSYVILRNELRYQFDKEGYLFGFFDGAYYENNTLNRIGAGSDYPFATGLGITFGTRAGLFSLSYALGSQQGNPLLLRTAKVHFGFLSLF